MNNGYDPSPSERITQEDLNYITETVCIITDKVYAHCQQRECFPQIELPIEKCTLDRIRFRPGFIVDNTIITTDIPNRPNFKRVRFTLRIPYEVITKTGKVVEGFLPDIFKDIILFIPEARDEFDFRIVVETKSQVLGDPIITDGKLIFAVGVFMIIKVVGRVQLLVPAFGFCPEPPECEPFTPDAGICDDFEYQPFPDFFPPQFEDLYPEV